jgi:Flp pilus assembly protein TadG
VYHDDSSTMNQTDSFDNSYPPIEIRPGGERVSAGNKHGQSLIEFTLVMPILLLMMTGMLSFGFALHNYLILANGVTAGAQLLAISRGQTTDPCATAFAAVKTASLGLTTASLSMTFVINGTTYTTTSCTAGAALMVQGASAAVAATYPCTLAVFGMNFSACKLQMQTAELIQ